MYFEEGYTYKLILCFLAGIHGVVISLSTLKRMLKRQNLRVNSSWKLLAGELIWQQHNGYTKAYINYGNR